MYLQKAAVDGDPSGDYPYGLPAVRALSGIDFAPVTVLVGDNGSGKSTVVEALAIAAGFNAEGGSRNLLFETYATHSDLADQLVLRWNRRPKWGWFLRAETFYGMASHIHEDSGLLQIFPDLHHRSHGESFLTLIESRMTGDGLYFLDEPESALSFHGQLKLLAAIDGAVAAGAQFIVATHSPVLMALPGAVIYEFDGQGAHRTEWSEVESVELWRSFLDAPDRFFRHLLDEGS